MRLALPLCIAIGLRANTAPLDNRNLPGRAHEELRATFCAQDDELRTSGRGNEPSWLHTDHESENFRRGFEYKLAQWAEAGIILRAPPLEGDMDWRAVHRALTEIGYSGTATVELPGGNAEYLRDVCQRVDKVLEGV
jgi:hypothetical protein